MLQRLLIAFVARVDRTMIYICNLLHDKHGTWQLPPELIGEIARCLLPDVVTFYETTEGQEEYAQHMLAQKKSTVQKAAENAK